MKELNGGLMKPQLGFGTWLFPENEVTEVLIKAIRDYGYRMVDTAKMYKNEEGVGRALKYCFENGIVKREEMFVATKLWIDGRGRVEEELKESLKRLQLDYVD